VTSLARALWVVALATALAACGSPEATRLRSGGPGADPGNRRDVVQMHEGSRPYWHTPRRLADSLAAPSATARQADRLSCGETPAASLR
jgi:uncharacterized lipoprotein YmbA